MTTLMYVLAAVGVGLTMYLGISSAFEVLYYRRRREEAAEWKCQPRRWLSPAMLRKQLILGTANVAAASVASGLFASYVAGGGRSALYFDLREHGLAYTVGVTIVYFLVTDAGLYFAHRTLHRPLLFRHIHRLHHRFVSPNAFTAMAMHPVELVLYQTIMIAPVFVLPMHVASVILVLLYQNYVGMLDHSGVILHSWLPWQPSTRFHDDHHVHFHVNYGQNLSLWDWLFGTYRREGRVYGEAVFGGRGAPADGREGRPAPCVDYGRPRRPAPSADVTPSAPAAEPAPDATS
ncbi:MAG TPA: sterol desaturase family protein [Polyangiaceae bacterium]